MPVSSSWTSQFAHSCGTPNLVQAIRITFFDTLSNARVMSHEHVCKTSPFSIASSSMLMNMREAVMVLRPAQNPCCACRSTSFRFHTSRMRWSSILHHSFLMVSTSIKGRRSPTLVTSCSFFGIATSHLSDHQSSVPFSSQTLVRQ